MFTKRIVGAAIVLVVSTLTNFNFCLGGPLDHLMIYQYDVANTPDPSAFPSADGLAAAARFELISGENTTLLNRLRISLSNISQDPFGYGDSNMVLSSINFDLGDVTITGGSVSLRDSFTLDDLVLAQSQVVNNNGSVWEGFDWEGESTANDLDDKYGYSNTGIGNKSDNTFTYKDEQNQDVTETTLLSGVTSTQIDDLQSSAAATSHNNGGQSVTTFNGSAGLPGGGLDFGLVAENSTGFGGSSFIQSGVVIELDLSGALTDLSFLRTGSYVEFGSDYAYVGAVTAPPPGEVDPPGSVPEPASLAVWCLGLAVGTGLLRRRRNR